MDAWAEDDTLGIYISVPFCRAKCSFCNFASGVSSAPTIDRYISALCGEIDRSSAFADRLRASLPRTVDTVYFGGGTPSLLTPIQLQTVFAALERNFEIRSGAEITMEAAPGQIDDELLAEALQLGINRVSLGVQSFVDRESSAVGRTHTQEQCLAEISRLQRAGLCDIGADLIAGLPFQTEDSWKTSLALVSSAGLSHASVYMLEVDDDSRLGREVLSGGLRLHAPRVPSEDVVAACYELACEELPQRGFAQYEISNFAVPGFEAMHNCKYWERAPYLGFGLDAHSMLRVKGGAVRFANKGELDSYFNAIDQTDEIESTNVGTRKAFEESIFLGLRLSEGVAVDSLRGAFPAEWIRATENAAREMASAGLMLADKQRWRLTTCGRLLSNDVFTHLLVGVAA